VTVNMKYTESLFDFNRKPTELPSLQREIYMNK